MRTDAVGYTQERQHMGLCLAHGLQLFACLGPGWRCAEQRPCWTPGRTERICGFFFPKRVGSESSAFSSSYMTTCSRDHFLDPFLS